jgi:hypothetical protein
MTNYAPEFPNLVGDPDATLLGSVGTAGSVFARRVAIKMDGTLHDLAIFHDTGAGNCRLGVYDVGVANPSNYTLLFDSGSVALSGSETWQIIGDPARLVSAGQVLDFVVMLDSTTPQIGRKSVAASPQAGLPNAGYMPTSGGTAIPKRQWSYAAGAYAAFPVSITESQAQVASNLITPCIIGRVG